MSDHEIIRGLERLLDELEQHGIEPPDADLAHRARRQELGEWVADLPLVRRRRLAAAVALLDCPLPDAPVSSPRPAGDR